MKKQYNNFSTVAYFNSSPYQRINHLCSSRKCWEDIFSKTIQAVSRQRTTYVEPSKIWYLSVLQMQTHLRTKISFSEIPHQIFIYSHLKNRSKFIFFTFRQFGTNFIKIFWNLANMKKQYNNFSTVAYFNSSPYCSSVLCSSRKCWEDIFSIHTGTPYVSNKIC